jgi:hypothetical protein
VDQLPAAPAPRAAGFALASGETSAWFRLPQSGRVGFFLAAPPSEGENLRLEWGSKRTVVGSSDVATDSGSDARPDLGYWRFYAAGDLPARPPGATSVRFSLASSDRPGAPVGLTAPVTYRNASLAAVLEQSRPVLALPNLVPYVPCVREPRVSDSTEVPGAVVAFRDSMWPVGTGTSPFDGVTDLYPLVRLPLSDSSDPPGAVALYEVDTRIDGGAIASPTVTRSG